VDLPTTQDEIERRTSQAGAGLTRHGYGEWERGVRGLTERQIRTVAHVLGLPLRSLERMTARVDGEPGDPSEKAAEVVQQWTRRRERTRLKRP
jgi:hypothetical protein